MPRPSPWSPLPLLLAACLAAGTEPASAPAPASTATRDAPAVVVPLDHPSTPSPDPALPGLRAAHPIEVPIDPARDRDGWFAMARALADQHSLAAHYRGVGFDPHPYSRVLTVAVRPGVGQPRYFYYSLGDTGFAVPRQFFHPASTVKLAASIGALRTVGALGLTGDVQLEFNDGEGHHDGKLADAVHEALMHSSNRDYNRLVRIAGFDALNVDYLSPRWGLPEMAVQARYGSRNGPTLRTSPAIRYREGEKTGELPAREGKSKHPGCRGNCATLFELHDIQRRVILHDELPEDQRFPIDARDVARMRETMRITRKRFGKVPEEAFGAPVEIFNNVGRIPRLALLENATMIEPKSGRRLFIVASVAFPAALGDSDAEVVPRLRALVRPSLDMTLAAAVSGPGLQHDAGVQPRLTVSANTTGGVLVLVETDTEVDARVWIDRQPLTRRAAGRPAAFVGEAVAPGEHVVVVELGPETAPTGYHASLITLPGASGPSTLPGASGLSTLPGASGPGTLPGPPGPITRPASG